MRKIAILTGTRAEYGILTSLIKAIQKHPDLIYELIVTGMHISPQFGTTINEIKKDKAKIGAEVDMHLGGNTGKEMAQSVGHGIIGIADALEKIKPDILVVLGDRGEPLAGAIAASHMNIPIAHLHGGEVTGTIDESIRHAITRFSHIHLPATKKSVERLIKMGEDKKNIYLVGAPGLDPILHESLMTKDELYEYLNFDKTKPFILAVQHPVTTEFKDTVQNTKETVNAITKLNMQTIFIGSNSDAGTVTMTNLIEKLKQNKLVRYYISIPHKIYLSAMKFCSFMISNSSSGIIEAPSFGIPVINLGTRQQGRERAKNIIDIDYNIKQILRAADKALHDKEFIKMCRKKENPYNPFRDAQAGERTAQILAKIKIDNKIIQKKITY